MPAEQIPAECLSPSLTAEELVSNFQNELTHFGRYTFEGPISCEYQPFVDYWAFICCNLHGIISQEDQPQSSHPLIQQLYQEQLSNGRYTIDTPMCHEYQEFIDLWEKTAKNLWRSI